MKNTFLVLSFFFMIGCTKEENLKGNNNNIEQPTDSIYPKNIDFTVIRANTLASAYNGKEWIGYIINDDNTWATYYNDGFFVIPDTSVHIDFSNFSVIAVFDSVIPFFPLSFNVLNVTEYRDSIIVKTTSNCCEGTGYDALAYPYALIRTSKIAAKPIVLRNNI